MNDAVNDRKLAAHFVSQAVNLVLMFDIADEDWSGIDQLGDGFLSRGRANDINDLGSGSRQFLANEIGDALAIRHAEDQDRFIGELQEIGHWCPHANVKLSVNTI